MVEGRGLAEGNTDSSTRPGRSAGSGVPSGLDRVREVARTDKQARFAALLHHVEFARLWTAYQAIRPKAAAGVDGMTWAADGRDLEANLGDLHARVHSDAYRASPSRRVYIPKADGWQRPLGIATLEDKILQRAVVEGSTPSTRRTSWASPRGSGRGVVPMTRWMRWRSGSNGRG